MCLNVVLKFICRRGFLGREAASVASTTLDRQLSDHRQPPNPGDAIEDALNTSLPELAQTSRDSIGRSASDNATLTLGNKARPTVPWREPQVTWSVTQQR
jgi:hypothetical protein